MTASTVKGVQITAIETSPIVLSDRGVNGGEPLKIAIGSKAVATTSIDETNDIILLAPVPSSAVIHSITILNDDLDSHSTPALAVDVGIYYSGIGGDQKKNSKVSGDAVDVDAIGTAITTLQSANVTPVDITFETRDIVDFGKQLWEIGGLTSDCGGLLYIGLKVTTAAATAAAGDIVMRVIYR